MSAAPRSTPADGQDPSGADPGTADHHETGGDAGDFARLVTGLLHAGRGGGWRVERAGTWTLATPGEHAGLRAQGWKLHLSAVPSGARGVLERAVPVLAEARCPFKFAASCEQAAELTGRHFDRGSAGKFLTAYPDHDTQLPALAEALDAATRGLPGPRILSDKPYRPGSLVHYRFGGFLRVLRLADNGTYEPVLTAPDGTVVPDRRDAWFAPPPWAPTDPFAPPPDPEGSAAQPSAAPKGVLIGGRYLLRGAIRHANKGGVFRATDRAGGEDVVVKQGRRHVEVRPDGGDVTDLLRHEARVLDLLAPTGRVPALRALLELPEHTFLVEQAVTGVPLRVHLQRLHWARAGRPDHERVRDTALRLVALLRDVHAAGVVVRDLTPANVMVRDDGELCLIDLELAALPGEDAVPGGSPGYAAPEQWNARHATVAADLYSLGAVLFALATGAEPHLAADGEPRRTTRERLAGWLEWAARDNPSAAALTPSILGLLHDDPAARPPLDRVRDELAAPPPAARGAVRHDPRRDARRLLDDGLRYLIAGGGIGADPDEDPAPGTRRWWPADPFGATTDPCNVYYGAAGVLAVLAAAGRHRDDEAWRNATGRAARWLERQAAAEPRVLPGLHFGRSGTYWALLEAGLALGDGALVARTAEAAELLPSAGPVPDVSHGIAGSGLTALRLWRATGRPALLALAASCADTLLAAAVRSPDGVCWPVPPQPPYLPRGATHHGFAHGTAGVAAFLLDLAGETGRQDCLTAARLAGRTLCEAASWGEGGTARWSAGPDDSVPLTGWCSGAAGVGGFLLRLWRATGEREFGEPALAAASAVRHDIWQTPPVHCHGTAGSVDYLLDVFQATGEERYARWAREAVGALTARAVRRDGMLLTPGHGGTDVFPGWAVGSAGVVAALLRLETAGPSLFMPPVPGSGRARTPGGHGRPRNARCPTVLSESHPTKGIRHDHH